MIIYIPVTPGGTVLFDLRAKTEVEAWKNLMKDAAHMPYRTIENFKARGYTIDEWQEKA